jgi:hypothetical protein
MSVSPQATGGSVEPQRGGFLSERRWDPIAPLAGIPAVVLIFLGGMVSDSGNAPEKPEDATPQRVLTFFSEDEESIFVSTLLFVVGIALFMWFAAAVRARLAAAEPGSGRLASLALAGATGMAVLILVGVSFMLSGAIAVDEDVPLAPETAQALWIAGDGAFFSAWIMAGIFLAATAVSALRSGLFPSWLAWLSLAMAVALFIPWIGWAVFLFLLPLWIIGVAVLLWRTSPRAA